MKQNYFFMRGGFIFLLNLFIFTSNAFAFTNEVIINQSGSQADPTTTSPVEFTVTFNEAVTGFDNLDIDLSGSTAGGSLTASVSETAPMNGTTFKVSVTGMTTDGSVIASVPAGAATLVSDGVTTTAASTSTDNTVTFDGNPVATGRTPNDNATGILVSLTSVSITFNENVVNVGDNSNSANQIHVRNVTTNTDAESIDPQQAGKVSISGKTVTINLGFSLSSNTNYAIRIGSAVIEDAGGNTFAGTDNDTDWNFQTESAPAISSYSASQTCVGETFTINGNNFGAAVPTVKVNGVNATVLSNSSTSISITIPTTTSGVVSVKNNSNMLSGSGASVTVNSALLTNLNVVEVNPTISAGNTADIQLQNSQNSVTYTLRQTSPSGGTSAPKAGTGGTLTFTTSTLTTGSYQFKVRGTNGSCVADMADVAYISAVAFSVNAGNDTTICKGDGLTLGGSPTITGGNGFNMITWSADSYSFSSTNTNPIVAPAQTTVYTVSVEDSNGNMTTDTKTVTVKDRPDPTALDIAFSPDQVTFNNTDDAVDLTYTQGANTGTGTFSGNAVNPSTKKFYPNAAPLGNNDISLTFTGVNGCAITVKETVNVYDPNAVLSPLQSRYCAEGTTNLTVQIPPGYIYNDVELYSVVKLLPPTAITTGTAWTKSGTQVVLNPKNLAPANYYFRVSYTYTYISEYTYTYVYDKKCKCFEFIATPVYSTITTYRFASFSITVPPIATIAAKSEFDKCKIDDVVDLVGSPIGGIWQGPATSPKPGNDSNSQYNDGDNGLATFTPNAALIGTNNLRYIFKDNTGCSDTAFVTFNVKDAPTINFVKSDGCVGLPVSYKPSVSIPPTVTVDLYLWDFGDGSGDKNPILVDPIEHTYNTSNNYNITFSVTTVDGCEARVTKPVSIGDIPDLKFTWANVCEGDPTRFAVKSNFLKTTPTDVKSITWDFGDGSAPVVKMNPAKGDSIQTFLYGNTGYYTATATIESDLGCATTKTLPLYKVPKTGLLTSKNTYLETFDGTFMEQGWATGGQNSSWALGVPNNTLINTDASGGGNAWVTNLDGTFNINEKSWVHSPCINLSQLERPVLSLDIRSLTRNQVEGAVLQITKSNATNTDGIWKTVGKINTGVNWYNETGIFTNPGNQALEQTGWTGPRDSTEWRHSIIALDEALSSYSAAEKSKVRFRIAFSSPADTSSVSNFEGFAFDNVAISQRDRIILLENFVNTGGSVGDTNANSAGQINNFINGKDGEIIKLEYHVGMSGPAEDPIYQLNPIDANARAAFYGVTSTPYIFLDGATGNNFSQLYSNQTLKAASATIDTIFTRSTPVETLNIEVKFTAKEFLPKSTTLHIAVVEKEIVKTDNPEAFGTNGVSTLQYVMRKMLPNALGTRFPNGIKKDSSKIVSLSWSPRAYDLTKLAIIAFLQNEKTGEIFQARELLMPQYIPDASVITGLETSLSNQIAVYPNPANEDLFIRLPQAPNAPIKIEFIDAVGRTNSFGEFLSGELTKSIATDSFAPGIYILQLTSKSGLVGRKKVLIVH